MAIAATKLAGGGASTATVTPSFTAQAAGVWLLLVVSADDYRLTTGSNRPESSGWTLSPATPGQDEIGFYVWVKLSTGAESSVSYSIGSATVSAWEVIAVSGATGTIFNTPTATHTHGGSSSASGSVTPPSGNGYALALFGAYHSSVNMTGATLTNSYTLVGFQTGPTSGNRENVLAAGLATTTTTSTSTTATWTGTSQLCSFGTILAFSEASSGYTATGGVTLGGTATPTVAYPRTATGGLNLGGSAPAVPAISVTASGGVTLGGTATTTVTYPRTATGGVTLGGTATPTVGQSRTATGGITLGGTADTGGASATRTASGGVTLGGTATQATAYTASATGGIVLGGSAPMSIKATRTAVGVLTLGGVGVVSGGATGFPPRLILRASTPVLTLDGTIGRLTLDGSQAVLTLDGVQA